MIDLQTVLENNSYYTNINEHLLEQVPTSAKYLLEVGCAEGVFGRVYKEQNPAARYIGIESEAREATVARNNIDLVINKIVEQVEFNELNLPAGRKLDCIIYGDVLEHLFNPWIILKRQAEWLEMGGYVIASIPNVGFWSVLHDLLHGRWNYVKAGVMDITHLRFFTENGIKSMFTTTDLVIKEIIPRRFENVGQNGRMPYQQFYNAIKPALVNLNIDLEKFDERAAATQYVVIARKPIL